VQFDMNRLPSTTDYDEEAVVTSASPSSNITGMKRGRSRDQMNNLQHACSEEYLEEEELHDMSNRGGSCVDFMSSRSAAATAAAAAAAAGGGSDDEDGGNTRKKLRLSKEQSLLLEESFKDHSTLNPVLRKNFACGLSVKLICILLPAVAMLI
jgi:homeobox-leucine zipper protein